VESTALGGRALGRENGEVDETDAGGPTGFLTGLAPAVAAELQGRGARRRFPGGATLFIEGDPAHEVLVLLDGKVKITVGSVEGREVILDVLEPGVLLGELSVIDGGPRSATVSVLTAVEVLAIPADSFNDFLDGHPQVLRRLVVDVIGRLRTRTRHQLEFGTGDALGRTCARLSEIAARYGKNEHGQVIVASPVSQTDLAAWTGLSRVAVVKALRALRELGWIENRGRAIVIHEPEQLRLRATR
jgi:CRP/FNR family cyclic AMP-dependent transcriptional regulator